MTGYALMSGEQSVEDKTEQREPTSNVRHTGYAKFLSSFLSYCLKIRRELESREGGSEKTPMRPFGERTGEYDTCL